MRCGRNPHLAAREVVNERRMRLLGWYVIEVARQAEAAVLQICLRGHRTAHQRPLLALTEQDRWTDETKLFK